MPFHFTCPNCYHQTLVDDAMAGQSGRCIECGKFIRLPASEASPSSNPGPQAAKPRRLDRRKLGWGLKLVALAGGAWIVWAIVFYTLLPVLNDIGQLRNRTAGLNNLQRIAAALNSYADQYGSYPPSVVCDASGKPMHSWRVLILEHLGETSLYNQYDFNEPWDSPANSLLLSSRTPAVYVSPANQDGRAIGETNYFLITGQGTLFPPGGPLAPIDVKDGLDKTLLIVESDGNLIEWTQPVDIDSAKLNPRIGATGSDTIGGTHSDGAAAVFADGSPAWLPNDLAPELLNALISPDGNEPISPQDYRVR